MPRLSKRHRSPRYVGAPPWKKPRPASKRGEPEGEAEGVRLQKVLAAAGVGSRRQCEELIREGRVDVDGEIVTELGTRVEPDRQQIRVDGERLRRPKRVYYLVNKPVGILTTNRDPSGRPRVVDLAPSHERLFTVGRLDKSSEGLILVTNDGQLTDLLTHPRYGVEKTYLAQVVGVPTPEELAQLRRGVHFSEGFARAKQIRVRHTHKHSAVLEIVLDEGRNREVRRLLARIGHKVLRLKRVAVGPLRLGNLRPGESRTLDRDEIEQLFHAAHEGRKRKRESQKAARRDKPLTDNTGPLVDLSVPVDNQTEPGDWPSDDADLAALAADEFAGEQANVAKTDARMEASEELRDFTSDEEDFHDALGSDDGIEDDVEVDVTPVALGDKRKRPRGTVIGADRRPNERGNRRGGHGKGQNRQERKVRSRQGKKRGESRQGRNQPARDPLPVNRKGRNRSKQNRGGGKKPRRSR